MSRSSRSSREEQRSEGKERSLGKLSIDNSFDVKNSAMRVRINVRRLRCGKTASGVANGWSANAARGKGKGKKQRDKGDST